MSDLPAPSHTNWLIITEEPSIVNVLGSGYWYSHWNPKTKTSYRCQGHGCDTCKAGNEPDIRYVFLVRRLGSVERNWLELRRTQYKVLSAIQNLHGNIVGARLIIRKMWAAKNAPVEVVLDDWKQTDETNITRFVESLGIRLSSQESYVSGKHGVSNKGK